MPNHKLDYELHKCPECGEEDFRTPALETEGQCSECGYEGDIADINLANEEQWTWR